MHCVSYRISSDSTAIHIHGNTGVNIEAPMGDVLLKSSDEIVLHSTDNSVSITFLFIFNKTKSFLYKTFLLNDE